MAVPLLVWVSGEKIDNAVLFSNLTQEDAGAIVEKLKAQKVLYQLEGGGTTILVPKSSVYDLRLSLVGQGLPRGGGVGFEVFDRQTMGTTDFVQKLNYQRALQGELSRTISRFPEVEEARIHIVTPKDSLFVEEHKKASAAVVLKLRRGRNLGPAQIDGIVHLISSSVEGLEPSQVTVVDMTGKILSKPQDPTGAQGLNSAQMEYQQQLEAGLRQKAQTMLEKIVGPNKAIVRISADVDFQRVNIQEDRYVPDRDLIRSEQKTSERKTSEGAGGGIPESRYDLNKGAVTPTPPGQGPPPLTAPAAGPGKAAVQSSGGGFERKSETINYELNRLNRQVVEFPGKIKRLSVAVVVDGTYKDTGKKKDQVGQFSPRSPEEMRNLSNLIKNAVGFSRDRGDQLEISCIPLAAAAEEAELAATPAKKGWQDLLMENLQIGIIILLVLGVLMFLWRRRRAQAVQGELEAPGVKELPPTLDAMGLPLPAPAGVPAGMIGSGTREPIMLPETVQGKDRVGQLLSLDPARAVDVLRLWLHDKEKKR